MSLAVLTWPLFLELVLHMLIGNIDQMMISRYSNQAVAAIGNVNQIIGVLTITFSVITLATTIMVTQHLGAGNKKGISKIYSVAVASNLFFSIIISGILIVFGKSIFTIMNVPQELIKDATLYMNIVGGFIFIEAAFMSYSAIFRSNGLMKQTLIISLCVNIINIFGNYVLIYGAFGAPQLGIAGVAISSVVSRMIGLCIVIRMFKRYIDGEVAIKYLRPFPTDLFKKLVKVGLPAGGESISYSMTQMVILSFINMMGTVAISSKIYAGMIVFFSYLYSCAVAEANQILVGYLIGANEEELAEKRAIKSLLPALMITFVLSIFVYCNAELLIGLFTDNQQIIKLAKQVMFIDILLELGRTVNMILIRSMQAAGDTKFPVKFGIASMWCISVVFSYLLGIGLGWGSVGVWIAMTMDEILRAVIFIIRWKKGSWKGKRII